MQLTLTSTELDYIADSIAQRLTSDHSTDGSGGYLDSQAAADYLGCGVNRVYDLKSLGKLVPDGSNGTKPLYIRSTLDAYVQSEG